MVDINVKEALEENLNKFAKKEEAKGTSKFAIVKNIAQVIKPFAKVRRRQDVLTLVSMLEVACAEKDQKQCERLIAQLQEMAKREALLPFRAMKQIAEDIVNFGKKKEEKS